jgi:pyridoxine/pyridoxamine 5'-phosphate oxidase
MIMDKAGLLSYIRAHKLAVIGTIGPDGGPQGAVVGIAATDDFAIVFDTLSDSRKHQNLRRDGRLSVTLEGPGEQTVQLEGRAYPVSATSASDASYRNAYYSTWPDGPERLTWPKIAYWRVEPRWARYSDYARGPLIVEFVFD